MLSRDKNFSTKLTEENDCAIENLALPKLVVFKLRGAVLTAFMFWLLESYWRLCCYSVAFVADVSSMGVALPFLCCAYFWRAPKPSLLFSAFAELATWTN
jgi:hypothetical protein